MMRMYDIIVNKRNGLVLSPEEIRFFIKGVTEQSIPDYQTAALLMAIYFQGMNGQETLELTEAMMYSGETLDLSHIAGVKVDKHSTGGVGDKTTLILAPLVAAAGANVAKMSGKGIGHTGGTVDKLSSFEGFNSELSMQQFSEQIKDIGIAVNGQTANLVPADKRLYALRDVTATVGNISLIAASIMSKKLASGSDAIVLDVKVGAGAFMKNTDTAFALAREMVKIGEGMGRQTVAIISAMEQPLGKAVGNAIEVKEAIDTLKGNGPKDLVDLCLTLGSHMLTLAQIAPDIASAKRLLLEVLENRKALKKFEEMVAAQGGNGQAVNDPSLLPQSKHQVDLLSPQSAYIHQLNARTVGMASMILGAGRKTKLDEIDLSAGIYLHHKLGDFVKKGTPLATLFTNDSAKLTDAKDRLAKAYVFGENAVKEQELILGKIDKESL